jgi:POT family proton-dependent oligopeptide transporter
LDLILVLSLYLFTNAFGAALDYVFLPLAKNPLFVWAYVATGGVATIAALWFGFAFRHVNNEEDEWNGLDKTSTNLPMPLDGRQLSKA